MHNPGSVVDPDRTLQRERLRDSRDAKPECCKDPPTLGVKDSLFTTTECHPFATDGGFTSIKFILRELVVIIDAAKTKTYAMLRK